MNRRLQSTARSFESRLRWQLGYYALHFIEGDHSWGQVRWLAAVVVIALFVAFSRLFEPIPTVGWFDALTGTSGTAALLPEPLVALAEFFASFLTRQTLRHVVPPLAGCLLALYFGARFLRDILELPNLSTASTFLLATLFSGAYPHMHISEGTAKVEDPEVNPTLKIGGPGWVHIKIGNAALFERLGGPSAVLGAGTHFIRRFETLREALDLRETERVKNDLQVITKDGIPLVLNEMRIRFRIRAREMRTESNPFPVMTGAVRQAVYSRKVTDRGMENWADTVAGAAAGVITSWIGRRRMDDLIPPPRTSEPDSPAPGPSYRQALHDLFADKKTRQRFSDLGAEIVWVSVGHLRPDPDVDPDIGPGGDPTGHDKIQAQFIETWKSAHEALARDELADAQGYARLLEDTARAQMQAEMILAITQGLRDARDNGLPMADVIMARMIEYLSGVSGRSGEYERLQSAALFQSLQKLLESSPDAKPSDPDMIG